MLLLSCSDTLPQVDDIMSFMSATLHAHQIASDTLQQEITSTIEYLHSNNFITVKEEESKRVLSGTLLGEVIPLISWKY
jgi:hypothetical protein